MKESFKQIGIVVRDDLEMSSNGINCLASTSTSLVAGSRDGVVREYNTLDRGLTCAYNGHIHWVNSVACSDSIFFSASSDSRILAWRWEITEPVQSLVYHKDSVHALKLNENFLYSGGEDGLLIKTQLDYKPSKSWSFASSIWDLDCQDNIQVIALASKVITTQTFKLLDMRGNKPESDFKGHSGIVRKVLLSPDKTEILTCSSDGFVKLWDLGMRKVKDSFHVHGTSVFALKCLWESGKL
jgi:WD40 repeat protein